jgi:OPA family sugar phosphate sensor protein UhpC-like MFS transporter
VGPSLRQWRIRVFGATWLSYAAYYFCRKPFYIAKPVLEQELGWNAELLGAIGACYLVAYALGQFTSSWLGPRLGGRVLVLTGMAISALANLGFGVANGWATFAVLMVVNGLAQATGWPGNVAIMAEWFRRKERGTVMGVWATNFQVGGVAANALAAYVLGAAGFRWSFFAGVLVVLASWVFYLLNARNRPQDVGLPAVDDDAADGRAGPESSADLRWPLKTWINALLIGGFYFFIKFIRYAVWSWAPYLLKKYYALKPDEAGYLSTIFDLAGVVGVIAVGFLSDRYFAGRRAKISFIFVLLMTLGCVFLYLLGSQTITLFAISIGLIGFCLYGPDALMSGAGAIEIGSRRSAAKAAGIINGMGAIGAVVQELVLGRMLGTEGVVAVFATLVTSSLLSAGCLGVLLLRNRAGAADV